MISLIPSLFLTSYSLIRRCCELNVYPELMPCTSTLTNLKFKLKGIILSRSPLHLPWHPGLVFLNISMDANSREIQEICWNHKGPVAKYDRREYGLQRFRLAGSTNRGNSIDTLFEGLGDQMQLWMSQRSTVFQRLSYLLTSTSLDGRAPLPTPPLHMTLSRSMASSSIQRLHIPLKEGIDIFETEAAKIEEAAENEENEAEAKGKIK
ncbi:uncharacterized protein HD556DRAFT_462230 [Suillus plorans]|uniref:Uncharacterized protein n=1 Tax=Suillus plorans TaxID=116603 RepID=A0A9P7DI17_9AGAM|nr:uncharacterized protein HD556DRAFT_462230 [Suillus plorans]KAG1793593.1 hypothetical protein HD556DRAFT_462230 [Suillus plorans]